LIAWFAPKRLLAAGAGSAHGAFGVEAVRRRGKAWGGEKAWGKAWGGVKA